MKIEGDINISSIIRKLKHGTKILSHLNWVVASPFNISVAGLIGVSGLIFAIKDGKVRMFNGLAKLSDKDSSLENSWVVPGLQNLGNNCFLNVILQALASCSSFRAFLDNILKESEYMSIEERVESLPLAVALTSLLEELCLVRHGREVLSPRRVMVAMTHYIPQFNLTSQQDAEEAFFHILSYLREELSECYVPNRSSLADVTTLSNCRILNPNSRPGQSDPERWRRSFLGPFDGILGSNLTCQSCSFQISLDFQFFHSLHLSPVFRSGTTIMDGCSLEDCLAQFFIAEQPENYFCGHCWHTAAVKYLSLKGEFEVDVERLKLCFYQDSCDCKRISSLRALPWSNSFSHTFKQLSIARCPEILCIHLQRASVNVCGEMIKLQGHISFPLILDLSPFMNSGMRIKNCLETLSGSQSKNQFQRFPLNSNHLDKRLYTTLRRSINGQKIDGFNSEEVVSTEAEEAGFELSVDTDLSTSERKLSLPETMECSESVHFCHKLSETCSWTHTEFHKYCLVSVVEHFGRSEGGHYTVFRRANAELKDGDSSAASKTASADWFSISDSQVYMVSEEDILAAEASVLFYEKILDV